MTDPTPAATVAPATLALFTQPAPPPGRTRGSFRLNGTPGPQHQPTPPRDALPPRPVARVRRVAQGEVDWDLVAVLRERVSGELSERDPDAAVREEVGREIIWQVLQDESRAATVRGDATWTLTHQDELAQALFDAVFRLGRLQPYLDDDTIENVIISGHDNVVIENSNGELVQAPAVASSDEQLIEYLTFMAAHQPKPREFSEAATKLHLSLPNRARLFASAWVTSRPTVIIRRNRLVDAGLPELVRLGSLTPLAAQFLSAAVQARLSLVVSGDQGTGKTTMLRALAHELPPHVQIGTIETEYELYLKDTGNHQVVHEWQANPGSGEIGLNGRRAGEYTVREALEDSLRANLSYTIVGEVRGSEIVTMFKCMQSGSGSMSTTHARSAEGAIRKLVTCATQEGANITRDYALNVIAEDIDLIVQLQVESVPTADGGWQKRRWVSEIIAVEPGEDAKGYATTTIFAAPPGTHQAMPVLLPDRFRDLERYGFDVAAFHAQSGLRP
ncbi:MAG: Flp pilus assembly complex ATPase component TadA [Tessaracoccus sp.]|uniref:CpaF family protein n=1 Tax=Tessaracoccus sp. TaxID=1971211 RepID=UPI001ECB12EA|nr:ATPase, T2SS/T4P/T4SS family [Tessaracoccus sp.]MBK7822058.1 Flp pilus assembly complex ATPase component TadA [Tessaracoccus sp.]